MVRTAYNNTAPKSKLRQFVVAQYKTDTHKAYGMEGHANEWREVASIAEFAVDLIQFDILPRDKKPGDPYENAHLFVETISG